MIKSIVINVIVLSAAAFLVSAPVVAQDNGVLYRDRDPDQAVKEFKKLLDLNEEQEARVTKIVYEHFAKRDSLMALYPEETEMDRLSLLVEMRRVPPLVMAWRAFMARFTTTCSSCPRSRRTVETEGSISSESSTAPRTSTVFWAVLAVIALVP